MDKTQAEAIAQAVLEPDLRAQEKVRLKKDKEAARLAVQRRHAGFALVGFAAGVSIGLLVFDQFSFFGLAGAASGWLASNLYGWSRARLAV